ncbi:MAG: fumarylacetoacetate hydrolase family protein [Solirubrobacterales bacterium]|nr:fumarylacetoacetate hydrolase family protein [Solirubrobacterales bacterium]MCB8971465.1 fumarylacetoacetate hydrolase family protein [Thermoleophilales bacterium]MCO5327123.1 fumarylacetoacetate hydrolase family protein [Solirubrobacterales bacterium]
MRLVSYRSERGDRAAVVRDGGLIDVADAIGEGPESLRGLLGAGPLDLVAEAAADVDPTLALADAELLPPIPNPQKIICIGLNYADHAAEANIEAPPVPTFFAKFANALVPDGATVPLPASSTKVDFEAEVAFVIGRPAKDVAAADALDHVAGYTLLNDLSARDLQFQTPQWIPGKVFDGSAPCGPELITADEVGDPAAIGIALDLNGERMQESSTEHLIFGVADLVAHLSSLMTLVPGDIVSTGTPAGVGSTRDPRIWLKPGDELVVSSPQLGELRTTLG